MSNPTTKARSLARRVTMGLLWAAAGGAAIVYGGALVYANVIRLEVDAAVARFIDNFIGTVLR